MELLDPNWTYERPEQKGAFYFISNTYYEHSGLIAAGGQDFPDPVDAETLDDVNRTLGEHFSDSPEDLVFSRQEDYPVRALFGRTAVGRTVFSEREISIQIVSWAKDDRMYFLCAMADPPSFQATVSEMERMLLSFRTTEEYSKYGDVPLPMGVNRGCSYEIPYSSAVCLENADGSCSLQIIVQIQNTGTVPLSLDGRNDLVVGSLLPGESALITMKPDLEEKPETEALTVEAHLQVEEAANLCLRYQAIGLDLRATPGKGLTLSGHVKNEWIEPINYLYIYVNLYDADHHPIGQLSEILNERIIEPGGIASFTASAPYGAPAPSREDVAYYEIFIYPLLVDEYTLEP